MDFHFSIRSNSARASLNILIASFKMKDLQNTKPAFLNCSFSQSLVINPLLPKLSKIPMTFYIDHSIFQYLILDMQSVPVSIYFHFTAKYPLLMCFPVTPDNSILAGWKPFFATIRDRTGIFCLGGRHGSQAEDLNAKRLHRTAALEWGAATTSVIHLPIIPRVADFTARPS